VVFSQKKTARAVARAILSITLVLPLATFGLGLSGCSQQAGMLTLGDPKLAPPTVIKEGVLTVGVDSSKAPFAGKLGDKLIGIDVDLAAAIAEHLGLRLELVDVSEQSATTLLTSGKIDMLMNYQVSSQSNNSLSEVGPYLMNGTGIFTVSTTPQTLDINKLKDTKIATQADSYSALQLSDIFGSQYIQTFPSLDEAFQTLVSGSISYAAADTVIGSYLASRYQDIICEGYLKQPTGVFIALAPNNQALTDAITDALRNLRDGGVLKAVVSKWLGSAVSSLVLGNTAIVGSSSGASSGSTNKE